MIGQHDSHTVSCSECILEGLPRDNGDTQRYGRKLGKEPNICK